jgi:cytoskeletal protein RodZ
VAEKKNQSAPTAQDQAKAAAANDLTLGQSIVEARERKGLSHEDVVRETHLPIHYVRMIESDNYGAIADQLYVLPFLRRYATFLDLDAEEVASRFVHDVQRSETNVTRMSDPITMVAKKRSSWRAFALVLLFIAVVVLLADFVFRHYEVIRRALHLAPSAATAVTPMPASTIETSVSPASPAEAATTVVNPAAMSSPAAGAIAAAPSSHATNVSPQPRGPASDQPEEQ